MADFEIKRGDRLPVFQTTLLDRSKQPITVPTGAGTKAELFMRAKTAASGSAPLVQADLTVADQSANKGVVSYAWQAGDTDIAADYWAEVKLTYATGQEQTYPTSGFIDLKINDDLESHLAALRIARQLGIRMLLEVTPEEVTRLRRMTDEMSEPQLYTDDSLGDLILVSPSLEAAASQIWEEKAALYLTFTDTTESGSTRKQGDLYTRAIQMANYYRSRANILNPPLPFNGGRATTRAIVRP
jgi:hypothetical protein